MIKHEKKSMIYLYISLILIFICVLILAFSYWQQNQLTVTEYNIENDKITENIKICMISDLHNKEFGKDNIQIIDEIIKQKPDITVIVGDMVEKFDETENITVVSKLIEQILPLSPIYYSKGNHESFNVCNKIIERFKNEQDFHFLIDDEASVIIKNQKFSIYGLNLYPLAEIPGRDEIIKKCNDFYSRDEFKLMLCHNPEYFGYFFTDKNIDLILSGHAHGGQIILPGIGGLFAPNQGFFPEYYSGIYKTDTSTLLVGRGLGNLVFIPRINNPPELIFINLS